MSYDVSFKAKLEGVDTWVYVGPEWVCHSGETATMIKELCGFYASSWDGKSCAEMLPILTNACDELRKYSQKYRQFENGYGTVENTLVFLDSIRKVCEEYPTAVIEMYC